MTELVFIGVVVFAAVYWIAAFACVVTFARQRSPTARALPPITVLKPLRGDDGRLYENLRSFCQQDYPEFEILFGVRDERDSAVAVVQRLAREVSGLHLKLVVDDRTLGTNRKVSNLANLVRHAKHDTLIIADSDMRVGPDYLRAVVGPLENSQVGLVTCLYRAVAPRGLASRLGAMFINEWFLPGALVGTHLEPLRHAFGATIACRRDTLAAIGGFRAIADQLADDYMLGRLVSRAGLHVVLVPYVVENTIAERSVQTLFLHELRWARTFRTLRPVPYFCSLFTYGIPLSGIWLAISAGSPLAWIATLAHIGLRCVGRLILYRSLGQRPPWRDTWLVPIRDVVSFVVGVLSFLGRTVRWNDERFSVSSDGRLERAERPDLQAPPSAARPIPRTHVARLQTGVAGMTRPQGSYRRTLFLHPPSYEGFDGGAGARYQARREIRSFWYPTWLAQPAALVPGSRLIDAPPDGLTLDDIRPLASEYELAVLHTSTPSFAHDVRVAEALKAENPTLAIGFVGAHVAVNPDRALAASPAIDFVARNEFDFTIKEVAEGRALDTVLGVSFRTDGKVRHMPDRPVLENMDALPFVVDVYKRDLVVEHYAIGYLLHPYVSLYTGRGCRSKCTFCLWPQTVGGHRYRTRSVDHVVEEIATAMQYFPQVREYFFDDDTLTDDVPRIEALARRLGKLGVTWSCNAKANVPYETLKILKDNGLRLLLVGYESGNQKILNNVKKGIRLDTARRFTKDAKALGITIHGTFILGLPGERSETIQETIRFARDIDPDTIQVSIAAPYPGTELFQQAMDNGWLSGEALVDERGTQISALSYPHLLSSQITQSTEEFYRRFYFRPRKIFSIVKEMLADRHVMRRRLREGREFLQFLGARARERSATIDGAPDTGRAGALQVVIPVPPDSPEIAALPAPVRAGSTVASLEGVGRVVFWTASKELPTSWRRSLARLRVPWSHVPAPAGATSLRQALDPVAPALVIAPNTVPDPRQARDLLAPAIAARQRATWLRQDVPVAAYYPQASGALSQVPWGSHDSVRQSLYDPDGARVPVPLDAWTDATDPAAVRDAERRLLRSLHQPGDGYLARFDRVLSIALSRWLIRTPITPNMITAASLVVGLVGATLLAGDTWPVSLLGAVLLWASCILDGCDGEVARLKLLTSRFGARFDVATDNVLHLSTFAAIAVHVHRVRPDLGFAWPSTLLLSGAIASMASVAWLINRLPSDRRLGFRRVYERIASRDYIYVVVLLTAVEHLEWFVWAAAVGANVFWLSLWGWTQTQRSR